MHYLRGADEEQRQGLDTEPMVYEERNMKGVVVLNRTKCMEMTHYPYHPPPHKMFTLYAYRKVNYKV